ncbi:MAG: hypothetical protein J6W24_06385 [Prevotella sp.]|nr:hypothetical protein [Prevotella sp.]
MYWIFIFVVIIIVWVLVNFFISYSKHRRAIVAQGGMKLIYKTLIEGLLRYGSARIIRDEIDLVTIGGTFTDPLCNRECGLWSVSIQRAFALLNIQYRAHIDLGGGKSTKQAWDFPIDMDQEKMLEIIKRKSDEWDIFGIIK